MEIGVLYLSHAMLVLAELIVCSTRGFACILAKWFWPTELGLSFTYGSPEASCNKWADTYLNEEDKQFVAKCIENKATAHGRRHDSVMYMHHRVKKSDVLKLVNYNHVSRGLPTLKSATTVYDRSKPKNERSLQAKKHLGLGLFCAKSLLKQKTMTTS